MMSEDKALFLVAAGAVCLLLALGGCGGGDSTSPLTKSEFLKQGNLICQRWEQEREEAYEDIAQKFEGKKVTRHSQEEAAITVLQRPYERLANKLAELAPPEGEEKEVEAIIEAIEETSSKLAADPGRAMEENPFQKPNELAVNYGLTDCRY